VFSQAGAKGAPTPVKKLSQRNQDLSMPLALYGHPFSSYTQKVLIALRETERAFEFRLIGPDTPEHAAEWLRRWPIGRFPMLDDDGATITESSIIIEHLEIAHPVSARLIPSDPMAALETRLIDRFCDLHVMDPVQFAVNCALGRLAIPRSEGVAMAAERLERSYGWLNERLGSRTWAIGESFTMADCAAAPSLLYADWVHRIGDQWPTLQAYRARLLARSVVAAVVNDARPFRPLFPLGAPDRD
jgi:glutathione S-transferase